MAEKKKVPAIVAPANSDKKKALETAIAKIEKDYGKGSIMRLGDDISVNVEALSTGSLSGPGSGHRRRPPWPHCRDLRA